MLCIFYKSPFLFDDQQKFENKFFNLYFGLIRKLPQGELKLLVQEFNRQAEKSAKFI